MKLFPYELKTVEETIEHVKKHKTNFYDYTFPTNDSSTYW